MGNFYFKKFTVRQISSAMKVNTDGVLLPAWVSLPETLPGNNSVTHMLDIGTGTGVISLVMAQRLSDEFKNPFNIKAIDIDAESAAEASFNFSQSPWNSSIECLNVSLQNYNPETLFSLILSNPPFFTDSLKAPSVRRSIARDNYKLPIGDIMAFSSKYLHADGILGLILPLPESEIAVKTGEKNGLFLSRLCYVKTVASKEPKRALMEFSKVKTMPFSEEELVIQISGGEAYTSEYKALVNKYYLKDLK